MRDGAGHAGALARRGALGVEQQDLLAERDGAGVLHGAGVELGHRQEIALGIGERATEVGLERGHERRHLARRLGSERGASLDRDDVAGDRHAFDRQHFQRARGHEDQIRGHRRCLIEDRGLGVARLALLVDRHVADHPVGDRCGHAHAPGDLERRLVEARPRFARVGGLEVGEAVGLAVDNYFIERVGVSVEVVGEGKGQRVSPGRDRLLGAQRDDAIVIARGRGERRRAGFVRQRHPAQLHALGVEPERIGGRVHLDLDRGRARVLGLARIERELQRLRDGRHAVAQALDGSRGAGDGEQGANSEGNAGGVPESPGREHPASTSVGRG